MATKREVYIIPGYGETHKKQKSYASVARLFEQAGYTPIHVDIDWKTKDTIQFGDYIRQFKSQFKKKRGVKTYVLGFSFGATIALLSAATTKPNQLILCSLSPYFTEDQKHLKPAWLRFWKKKFVDSDFKFADIAKKISSPVTLVVGGKEHQAVLFRARSARLKLRRSSLTVVKNAKHNLGQREYIAALQRIISVMK